jgi:hypothetical protein
VTPRRLLLHLLVHLRAAFVQVGLQLLLHGAGAVELFAVEQLADGFRFRLRFAHLAHHHIHRYGD